MICTCSFVKVAAQLSSQNFPMEKRDPVLSLSRIWPYWAEGDKYLLLMGMRTVWVVRMEFPLDAVMMELLEVIIKYLKRLPCSREI